MNHKYQEKKFSIPPLIGISQNTIDEHLKLYAGYVKNTNIILESLSEKTNNENLTYSLNEARRRLGFEFGGIKNHEIYFEIITDGKKEPSENSALKNVVEKSFGNFENYISDLKKIALERGIGWAISYFDKDNNQIINSWVDEQHIGHLSGLQIFFALDMWEHAYIMDYKPSGKKKYIDDFFSNINWEKVEKLFKKISE